MADATAVLACAVSDRSTVVTADARSVGPRRVATNIVVKCAPVNVVMATGRAMAETRAAAAMAAVMRGVAAVTVRSSANTGDPRPMPRVPVRRRLRRRCHGEMRRRAASRRALSAPKASAENAPGVDRAGVGGVGGVSLTRASPATAVQAQTATARMPIPVPNRSRLVRSRRPVTSRARRRWNRREDRRRTSAVRFLHRRPHPLRRSRYRRLRPPHRAATGHRRHLTMRLGKGRWASPDVDSQRCRTGFFVRHRCHGQCARMRARISASSPSAACSTRSSTRSKPTAPP